MSPLSKTATVASPTKPVSSPVIVFAIAPVGLPWSASLHTGSTADLMMILPPLTTWPPGTRGDGKWNGRFSAQFQLELWVS